MKVAYRLISVASLFLFSGTLPSQDVFPYRYDIDDFPNGLRLITVPTSYPDVVSIHIIVATGSRNEVEAGKSGFAHFFEHVMFRGSKNYTSAQQAAIFKKAGADRNAYTTNDYTNYHTTFAKEDLETIIKIEADRFRYLEYSPKVFRTESMAVLGEYNKNHSQPMSSLMEKMRDTAFSTHTYKHTTIGFLRDIRAMPRQFNYSREFFSRWYKPEYTTILVVGDVERDSTKELVTRYWGDWQRGDYTVEIPEEPKQEESLACHVKWPAPTQPWVAVAFKGPAFSTTVKDMPTLDVISALAFSENSEIYKKLFVRERKVTMLGSSFPDAKDPFLLQIAARVKKPEDVAYVRDEILAACEKLKTERVPEGRLSRVKANLKYSFAGALDSSEAIADALAGYIARTRTPEAVNKVYRLYDAVSPADIQEIARRYFVESSRTIGTLSHGALPAEPSPPVVTEDDLPVAAILRPSNSALISFRLVFGLGAALDPEGKEGLSYITARLLTNGSTRERSYEEIVEALFPMASSIGFQVDKEMAVFQGTVHRDNLEEFYHIFSEVILEPGWRQEDLDRVKSNTKSYIEVQLAGNNDEELGKEVLYNDIYSGTSYGHLNAGTLEGLDSITIEDVREFYARWFYPENLVLGLAGGYPDGFPSRVAADLVQGLGHDDPKKARVFKAPGLAAVPRPIDRTRMTIVEKKTLATGLHIGFPIDVKRGHSDWAALWLVRSYFGEHRSENSYLYQRLREIRGLNYGDYAYIEYFPGGMFQFHPDPNLGRSSQIFQIWIRPVQPMNGPFALKAACYELDKLVREGLSEQAFEATRTFLSKFASLLVKTQDRSLGYAIDSRYYEMGEFAASVKEGLAKLSLEDVNRAIRRHLRSDRLQLVVVTEGAKDFQDRLLGDTPARCQYVAKPSAEILAEDRVIENFSIGLKPEDVRVLSIEDAFRR